ncbi:MAG: histidinol-phosphatase [Helicobacteraceae bacterium]|jgi:histidinol-phosphatase (PHP family)|nr:histidinol-phosphatase [Helicobacteraceae bacterium]
MYIDLHNHTERCKHASGGMESFVKRAIERGVSVYGFSDHAPMRHDLEYRMSFDEMPSYEADFVTLKERFDGKIKLLLGYEADYLPAKTYPQVFEREVDYLIGSVHFLDDGGWGFDNPRYVAEFDGRDLGDVWREYFETIAKMAGTRQFNIAGHLDLIKIFGHFKGKKPDDAVASALIALREANMAIEINCAGWDRPAKEQYPSEAILRLALDLGVALTFGSDAHEIAAVARDLPRAYELARSIGFKEAVYFENREMKAVKI